MKEAHFEKTPCNFCNVHFSVSKKQIRENTCFKQHALLVDSLGVWNVFRIFQTFMFFRHKKKGGPYHVKESPFGRSILRIGAPKIPKGPIPIQKSISKKADSEFWKRRKGSEQANVVEKDVGIQNHSLLRALK